MGCAPRQFTTVLIACPAVATLRARQKRLMMLGDCHFMQGIIGRKDVVGVVRFSIAALGLVAGNRCKSALAMRVAQHIYNSLYNPIPYTLYHIPYTLYPIPYTHIYN